MNDRDKYILAGGANDDIRNETTGNEKANIDKALDELVGWCNKQGISFEVTATFDKECPTLAKLLGLGNDKRGVNP